MVDTTAILGKAGAAEFISPISRVQFVHEVFEADAGTRLAHGPV